MLVVFNKFTFFTSWNTYVVDGHDVEALAKAFHDAETVKEKPTAIVAKTYKGKGIPGKKLIYISTRYLM